MVSEQVNYLLPFILNFAEKYAIKNVHENQDGLKLSEASHLLFYAGNVNLKGRNYKYCKEKLGSSIGVST